ncbi:hypothetical protein MKZ38_000700 [Zalerion maritima]|uniref:NADH dehydrogenase [ubiquinone] iron-sulfur protein 5 n=1 Tax=Zalerion maritima TaxID=339359 RepID=A0AAD5RR49_9PEZI|nr:hypothetical protein MKZ38_000700 [Zalerion maritima]
MASGYGLTGGPSRCFPFWQEVLGCYVVNSSSDNPRGASKCSPVLDDYYECLHHKKERARATAMQNAIRKAEAEHTPENLPTAGEIRSLGLVGKEEISKTFYNKPKPKDE